MGGMMLHRARQYVHQHIGLGERLLHQNQDKPVKKSTLYVVVERVLRVHRSLRYSAFQRGDIWKEWLHQCNDLLMESLDRKYMY